MVSIIGIPNKGKNHKLPELDKQAFICPRCGIYATQEWHELGYEEEYYEGGPSGDEENIRVKKLEVNKDRMLLKVSICSSCNKGCLWQDEKMIYPDLNTAPLPNSDLPESAMVNYKEAASVFSRSPRAAAAMLRLVVQDICVFMGGKGKDMQKDIDYLIKEKELPKNMVKAMDAVRIVGNEAIHPGEMDLQDDAQTVGVLFGLVNRIAEKLITEPRKDEEFYASLPDGKKRKNRQE